MECVWGNIVCSGWRQGRLLHVLANAMEQPQHSTIRRAPVTLGLGLLTLPG